ncbi:hypothetical protein GCM10010912_29960 [Paenibacillus albidus]|uniref:Uncharacterized protein n=1 Tax=Paenibacillus albidus TaxID=2041023 RepID=A0A917FJ68_9BACL|nr:hypothetical protein [Paenibacillus albidus]GGF82871.1 hypothetical protein GCM10010912_29960 [Paenibacillus albidus]
MTIFKEITVDEFSNVKMKHMNMTDSSIVTINHDLDLNPLIMTKIPRFFIAPVIYGITDMLYLPIDVEETYRLVIQEIAPHFEEIKEISNETFRNLSLKKLKPKSKEIFAETKTETNIDLVIKELYGQKTEKIEEIQKTEKNNIKFYEVNLQKINTVNDNDFELLWNFIKSAYVNRQGEFYITPVNWIFNEEIRNYLFVRMLSNVCNSLRISVNDDSGTITSLILD